MTWQQLSPLFGDIAGKLAPPQDFLDAPVHNFKYVTSTTWSTRKTNLSR